jgi:hypothetical protein
LVEVFLVLPDLSRGKVEAVDRLSRELPVSVLVSYSLFKLKPSSLDRLAVLRGSAGVRVMLDSGAYHLRRLGLRVGVREYARFASKHHRLFDVVVAPDVPGAPNATMARTLLFAELYQGPFLPVLQGLDLEGYLGMLRRLRALGLDNGGYVGVGGLDGPRRSPSFLAGLADRLCMQGVRLHLFGAGLRLYKALPPEARKCVRSVDTGAWSMEIVYRRRSLLKADGDPVQLNYVAMKTYLERWHQATRATPHPQERPHANGA